MVLGDTSTPFYPDLRKNFSQQFQELGRKVLHVALARNGDSDDRLPLVLQHQVDGIIIMPSRFPTRMAVVS